MGCSLMQPSAGGVDPPGLATNTAGNNAPVVRTPTGDGRHGAKSLAHAVSHSSIVRLLLAAGAPKGELMVMAAGPGNDRNAGHASRAGSMKGGARVGAAAAQAPSRSANASNEQGTTNTLLTA